MQICIVMNIISAPRCNANIQTLDKQIWRLAAKDCGKSACLAGGFLKNTILLHFI